MLAAPGAHPKPSRSWDAACSPTTSWGKHCPYIGVPSSFGAGLSPAQSGSRCVPARGRVKVMMGTVSHALGNLPWCCSQRHFVHPSPALCCSRAGRSGAHAASGIRQGSPELCHHLRAVPRQDTRKKPALLHRAPPRVSHPAGSFPCLPDSSFHLGFCKRQGAGWLQTQLLGRKGLRREAVPPSWHLQLCHKSTSPGQCRGGVTAPLCPLHAHPGPGAPAGAGGRLACHLHRHPARSGGYPTCTSARAAPEPSAR